MRVIIGIVWCFLVIIFVDLCDGQLFTSEFMPTWKVQSKTKATGNRLVLSSLIRDGHENKARKLARVNEELFLNTISYSGYLTVNDAANSNLWFWFFPAQGTEHLYSGDISDYDEDDNAYQKKTATNRTVHTTKPDWENENRPLLLWLQGGPGSSSLFGLFTELGPFSLADDGLSLIRNNNSWHTKYSLLFIDNPVGTGFSFTDSQDAYATNSTQVGTDMYTGLVQFLKLFPWLQSVPFYVTGESYAGKYVPAIGYEIQKRNKMNNFKINLQGLAMGNALSDPYHSLGYSDYAFQLGLVDRHGWAEMRLFEILAQENIQHPEAKVYWDSILASFIRHSHYQNFYHVLQPKAINLESYLKFINQPHIRKALHVGNQEFASPFLVYFKMANDFMSSVMPLVDEMLDNQLRIMYYSGHLDFIVGYPENAYRNMKWSGSRKYKLASRKPWMFNNKLAGYVKKVDNFVDVIVLNAGHMVPTDQPEASLNLIERFVNDDFPN